MPITRLPIGLRTVKTVIAIIISLVIVDYFGASTAKVIFALIGAMSAVEVTFKASLRACFTQICGVLFGGIFGILMLYLPIDVYLSVGIGFILINIFYHALRLTLSPVLPCIVIATILTGTDIVPVQYLTQRLWDTLIGLTVGFVINVLFFPYDTSRQVKFYMEELDQMILLFLERYFDPGEHPDVAPIREKMETMEKKLFLMDEQKFPLHRKKQEASLCRFKICYEKLSDLYTELEALSVMETPGHLTRLNKERLAKFGVVIHSDEEAQKGDINDIVCNYHVTQILALRRELRERLNQTI